MTNFKNACTKVLSSVKPGSTFLTVHNYVNSMGEVADYSIVFHIDYLKAVERSLDVLQSYKPTKMAVAGKPYTLEQLKAAKVQVIDSLKKSLSGSHTQTDAYDSVEVNGNTIPGVKLHSKDDALHLFGLRVWKNVVHSGNYPKDTRQPLTVAKDDLRKMLPVGKFVQFKLTPGKFDKLVVGKMSVTDDQTVRELAQNMRSVA